MKHLASVQKTLDHLPKAKKKWTRLNFYFDFRAGGDTSNTIEGMWRSLASQLAEKLPEARQYLKDVATHSEIARYSPEDLKKMIRNLFEITDTPVLAFIDGLDEYTGNSSELARSLITLKDDTGMKICLASRPESSFISLFKDYPTLRMQDYNASSIRAHMNEAIELRRHRFRSTFPSPLKIKIVKDARGVILWARFAIDHLIDGCDEGLTDQELEKRLNDLPKEIEELYQRILDKLPSPSRSEAALILHLVIESPPETDLSVLCGAWLFVIQKTDMGFASVMLKDVSDFESRLLAIFGGLLDISIDARRNKLMRRDENFKYASLIHRTVQSYLDKSNWIQKTLPQAFLQRYPNSPWLRVCASVVEDADAELGFSRDHVFELLDREKGRSTIWERVEATLLSRSWHESRLILPFAICSLLELAEDEEESACSVFDIVHKAMNTNLVSLHVAYEKVAYERVAYETTSAFNLKCMPSYASFVDCKQLRGAEPGLFYGVSHGLFRYVEDYLQREPALSARETTMLLDLAVLNVTKDPRSRRVKVTRLCFQHFRQTLQSRHLCIIFDHTQYLAYGGVSTEKFDSIAQLWRDLVQDRPIETWPWDHHPKCWLREKHIGPLYHWLQSSRGSPNYALFCKDLLAFLLDSGERINRPCCSASHVLYALLDFHPADLYANPSRLWKFLLVVKAGADPQIAGLSTKILARARKLKLSLLIERMKLDVYAKTELEDVKAIVKILKDHKKSGKWTLFDRYYNEMMESTARNRSLPKDEVERRLRFTQQDQIGIDETESLSRI